MYNDLKGKVVILTGAGRPHGLSHGMSMRFAKEGCNVVVTEVTSPHVNPEYGKGSWDDALERKKR